MKRSKFLLMTLCAPLAACGLKWQDPWEGGDLIEQASEADTTQHPIVLHRRNSVEYYEQWGYVIVEEYNGLVKMKLSSLLSN